MTAADTLVEWSECIRNASSTSGRVEIVGGKSKKGYGHAVKNADYVIETSAFSGMVDYDPDELVLTARAGTPLADVEAEVQAAGQMLSFEPPYFGGQPTLGGCVATGLSGPRRPYSGAVRDSVLGVRMIDGQGRQLRFGGQVVKNVAGFDVARFMTGSLGTLGLLTEVSLKLVPRPGNETTIALGLTAVDALKCFSLWRRSQLPLSASTYCNGHLYLRLSGGEALIRRSAEQLGGEVVANSVQFWQAVRDHQHAFFAPRPESALIRLSVRADATLLSEPSDTLIEWGGALRWVWADASDIESLRTWARLHGGHASLFNASDAMMQTYGAFAPLPGPHLALLHRIKAVFDPAKIFNPGRMYSTL